MKRAIFLDRDGTMTKDNGYFYKYDQIKISNAAIEAIKLLNKNFLVVVITNQPSVARGWCSEEDVRQIHERIKNDMREKGGRIDAFYFCPHHPEQHDDVPQHARKYRIECECRKPKIGMIEQAVKDFDIDLENSFFIGDSTADVQTARNAGCTSILVKTGLAGEDSKYNAKPDFIFDDLLAAAKFISPNVKAVILAGGRGERLRPLTDTTPKPMIEIAGKPLLEHQITVLKRCGITEIVLCGSYLVDKIKNYFSDGSSFGVKMYYPYEPKQLGSGGTVKNAAGFLKDADRFIIINGDKMIGGEFDFNDLLDFDRRKSGFATVLVRETDHPFDSDILKMDENNRITQFIGRGQDTYKISNSGVIIAGHSLLERIPSGPNSLEKDVIFSLIKEEDIYGFMLPQNWYTKDIGTLERLVSVKKHFEGAAT